MIDTYANILRNNGIKVQEIRRRAKMIVVPRKDLETATQIAKKYQMKGLTVGSRVV